MSNRLKSKAVYLEAALFRAERAESDGLGDCENLEERYPLGARIVREEDYPATCAFIRFPDRKQEYTVRIWDVTPLKEARKKLSLHNLPTLHRLGARSVYWRRYFTLFLDTLTYLHK